jgi:hypothetical protein
MLRIPVADQPRSANSDVAAASTSVRVSVACC